MVERVQADVNNSIAVPFLFIYYRPTVHTAFNYESSNDVVPNFCNFIDKFDISQNNIYEKNKFEVKKLSNDSYDRLWWEKINDGPKALTYATFKCNVKFKKYLDQIKIGKQDCPIKIPIFEPQSIN